MPNRKNRAKKALASLAKVIEEHKQKIQEAKKGDNLELMGYYEKEIIEMETQLSKKRKILEK